jgi:HMG (high mobility group) box
LSAYNIFFQAERERIVFGETKAQDPDESEGVVGPRLHRKTHGKIGFADLARNIGAKWKSLPDTHKRPYTSQAEREQDRYRRELEDWKKTQEVRERDAKEWSDRREDISRDIAFSEASRTHSDSIADAYHDAVDSKTASALPMHLLASHHKSVTAEAASNLRNDLRNEKWITQLLSGKSSLPKAFSNLQGSYLYPVNLHDGAACGGTSGWPQLSRGNGNVAPNGLNEQAATIHIDMGSNGPPTLSYPPSLAPDQGDAMTIHEHQQYTLHQMALLASRRHMPLPPDLPYVQDHSYRLGPGGYGGGYLARNMQWPLGGFASTNTGVSNINMAPAQFQPYQQQDGDTHAHPQPTAAVSTVGPPTNHGEGSNAMVEHHLDEDCYDFLSRLRNAN